VYAHACESTHALELAHKMGLFVVVEALTFPRFREIIAREYRRLGLCPPFGMSSIQDDLDFFRKELSIADLVIAPSKYVMKGLLDFGVPETSVALVPYGMPSRHEVVREARVPGRVLFVANAGIEKGLHLLVRAAKRLEMRDVECDLRVVGKVEPLPEGLPSLDRMTLTGHLPHDEVAREYGRAEVFAFPTLSDGFGFALLEAIQAGLPAVCSPWCGDLVKDGFNGFVVDPHDEGRLAASLERLLTDSALRVKMGNNSRKIAGDYSFDRYRERLTEVIVTNFSSWERHKAIGSRSCG